MTLRSVVLLALGTAFVGSGSRSLVCCLLSVYIRCQMDHSDLRCSGCADLHHSRHLVRRCKLAQVPLNGHCSAFTLSIHSVPSSLLSFCFSFRFCIHYPLPVHTRLLIEFAHWSRSLARSLFSLPFFCVHFLFFLGFFLFWPCCSLVSAALSAVRTSILVLVDCVKIMLPLIYPNPTSASKARDSVFECREK